MKQTDKFRLTYFEKGDRPTTVDELRRWVTLDTQMYALFRVLGNGVIEGWNLIPSSGLSVVVGPGKGHVAFIAAETIANYVISNLFPSTRNYIYATLQSDTYWTKNVEFTVLTNQDEADLDNDDLYIGYVDTAEIGVTEVNTDDRDKLSFASVVSELVSEHRHIGGVGNPDPVNLGTDVQGVLNQENLPDIDASLIKTGQIDSARLGDIDHISQLTNQGTLTHAQLDSFVEQIADPRHVLMGETSTINLLQLVLALKHIYPDIDEYLVNEIAYIPGISPDSYVDWDNTTAEVDTKTWAQGGEHVISGVPSAGKNIYSQTWSTKEEFESGTQSNVVIDGSNVCLDTEDIILSIEEFVDLSKWDVVTEDLSAAVTSDLSLDTSNYVQPPSSAKLNLSGNDVEIVLQLTRTFDAQDWSGYNYLIFYLKTDDVEHGDMFFYLNDDTAGVQDSYHKILDRNQITVDEDTLQNGWQRISVDVSSYTRTEINTIGFYISSQDGWDTSKGFDFNLDNIFLTSGARYLESGYVRYTYGSNSPVDFWRVRWDAQIPDDTASTGIVFKARTRVGDSEADLQQSVWSAYETVSGTEISLPTSNMYKYIEIEVYLGASDTQTRTPCLKKLFLDFYASDEENSFTYDDKDDWDAGSKFNIDTETNPGSISIYGAEDIGTILYGTDGEVGKVNEELNDLFTIKGSLLPRSTYQVLNDLPTGLGLVTGVDRGDNGNVWLSDVDNDRVVELDVTGALVKGFLGSFLAEPEDVYGIEESGPGSNVLTGITVDEVTTTTTIAADATLNVLHSTYNPSSGILSIVFDDNIENIYQNSTSLNIDRIYLKIGTHRFYLNDSDVVLWGVDEDKYGIWNSLAQTSNIFSQYVSQFRFTSHILQLKLKGADKTLLNYSVNQEAPSIVIASPSVQQRLTSKSVTIKFLIYNFDLGTASGENGIRVTLDGVSQDIYKSYVTYNGLSTGQHTLTAQLLNSDGSLNTNVEAIAQSTFVVYIGDYDQPYLTLDTPKGNQIYSSSPVQIDFSIENFPIIATSQHLRYQVDSEAPVDHYSTDPISVDVEAGKHSIRLYLVDFDGNEFEYEYGSVTGSFIVGLNSNALLKLYVDFGAVYDESKRKPAGTSRTDVYVGNVDFKNIYSPIDVRLIPDETSKVNPTGEPSVLIGKLRSESTTASLGTVSSYESLLDAANVSAANVTSLTTSTGVNNLQTAINAIYYSKYLDGHSVVQVDMDGETIFSNNAAIFAVSKSDAKETLGSAEKIGGNELLVGDSTKKRAIIIDTDLDSQKPRIIWQYDSDRYIPDFHVYNRDTVTVSIDDDAIRESSLFVRQGSLVIWENNSSIPVSIYSGTTTLEQFNLLPDLNLYGNVFQSGVLQPGERFSYTFSVYGEVDYFVYPNILLGTVTSTRNRMSAQDKFLILESDGLENPFGSRLIKVDAWGNVEWQFGQSYIVKPRDARPLLNDRVIIST